MMSGKPLVTKHWKKPLEKPLEKQKNIIGDRDMVT
jgi:hypothetical protein